MEEPERPGAESQSPVPGVGRSHSSQEGPNPPGAKGTDCKRATVAEHMRPIDKLVYDGEEVRDSRYQLVSDVQKALLPEKVQMLRQKLHQKSKNEPKYCFYSLYDLIYRMDVLGGGVVQLGLIRP